MDETAAGPVAGRVGAGWEGRREWASGPAAGPFRVGSVM